MEALQALEEYLVPVPEEALKVLFEGLQERLCAQLRVPVSLLYIGDPTEKDLYRFEASAGLSGEPTPAAFRIGEGFLGQAIQEKKPLTQTLPAELLGTRTLSPLVEVEETTLIAIPLIYQDSVEGLWVLAAPQESLLDTLSTSEWKDFLYRWAAYLQSVRSRRYIQALLEQSQIQNQELISREEELRQNLEELAVTQEEMRRTQQLLAEKTRWQDFVIDLFTLLTGTSNARFSSTARIFLAQLGQYVNATATIAVKITEKVGHTLYSWTSRKIAFTPPEEWPLPETLLETLWSSRNCTTLSSQELNLTEGPPFWIVAPYFLPQGVGGLLLIGYPEPVPLEAEAARAFLHAAIGLFSSYERVLANYAIKHLIMEKVAQLTRASLQEVPRKLIEKGDIPWLSELPLVQRELYAEALQKALRENLSVWLAPAEIASKEIVLFLGPSILRVKWES
ncbi:MAG: hypothetical protein N3A68_04310 [Bacteroidia bacterium]|jgi:hypothetical protein|nr:hypothetical protein [Bacteroidia bacterium]